MTEKRFKNKGKDILQNNEVWCIANSEHCADVISTALNELINENEQLKQQLKDCTKKAKEEIRKQKQENAIRWANIGR